jgi:hypothetical protein
LYKNRTVDIIRINERKSKANLKVDGIVVVPVAASPVKIGLGVELGGFADSSQTVEVDGRRLMSDIQR